MALTEEQIKEAARVLKERAKARGKTECVWVVRDVWHKGRYKCRIEKHDIKPTKKTIEVGPVRDKNGVEFLREKFTVGHYAFLTRAEAVASAKKLIAARHEAETRAVANRQADLKRAEDSLAQFVADMPTMLADLEVEHTQTDSAEGAR